MGLTATPTGLNLAEAYLNDLVDDYVIVNKREISGISGTFVADVCPFNFVIYGQWS